MRPFAHIARISHPLVRVPLAYVIWPIVVCDCLTGAALDKEARRIFTRQFWSLAASMFWVVHDGMFVGVPITNDD